MTQVIARHLRSCQREDMMVFDPPPRGGRLRPKLSY